MAVVSGLERYRYISTLGSGGMATVSLAEDALLGRKVALKRLAGSGVGGAGELLDAHRDRHGNTRLKREALLGASVSHPNLVSIYDAIATEDGDLVVVMEYVPGETLSDRLARDGRMSPREALPVLTGVAAGLDAIHELGIVHRDVKPANVLLGAEDTVKLADLGIASVPDRTRITSAGAVLGTFRYMAPEQLEDGPSTPAIDVYALGCVAFEMLAGRKARPESNPMALAHAIATRPPPDLRNVWSEAPPAAAEVLAQAMARDPSRRPLRAGDLVARLRAALEPEPTAPIIPAPATPRRAPVASSRHSAPPLAIERRPTAVTANPPPTRNRARRVVPALLVAVAAAAVVAVVLAATGGDTSSSSTKRHNARPSSTARAPARSFHHAGGHRRSAGTTTGSASSVETVASPTAASPTAASSTSGSTAPATTAGSPVSAVQSFYHLAAAHDYSQAWALADPTFQAQLGGYSSFVAGQAADRSITFDSTRVISQSPSLASVAVQTTSVRQNGTQHCAGSVELVPASAAGTWLLHRIHITCS